MSWNYRIVHTVVGTEHSYGIHEAYGRPPHSITVDAVGVFGESKAELREVYRMMSEAFDAPILEGADFDPKSSEVD